MSKNLVFALHGFLGQGHDWDAVKKNLSSSVDFETVDLFSAESPDIIELEDYADELAQEIEEMAGGHEKKIFVGYSLGGRLGLHLLQSHPDLFDHFIFLSTHPGLSEGQTGESGPRLLNDMKWAAQISEKNWSTFLSDWNKQPVFEGSQTEPQRNSAEYDLNKLKRALVMWTVAHQEDFRELISEFREKITWVVGEKDSKYLKMAEDLKQKKILLDYKRISSGHRIWLDQPNEISKLVRAFV
jgi:2-succinyl-6-hydroxy-2,4-cyclohexadiene-1-carboxylate synthase